MKVNIDKIKSLAKEKGFSIAYICESVGMGRGYLNDIRKSNGGDIPDDRLQIIINILNTTIEYLTDQTDIKTPPADADDETVSEFGEWMGSLSADERKELMNYARFLMQKRKE